MFKAQLHSLGCSFVKCLDIKREEKCNMMKIKIFSMPKIALQFLSMKKIFILILFSFILIGASGVLGLNCWSDAECLFGDRCYNHAYCVSGCNLNSQCPIDTRYCDTNDNICKSCTSDSQCPNAYSCTAGACVPKPCIDATSCGTDRVYKCVDNFCKPNCAFNSDCVGFLRSSDYLCLGTEPIGACYKNICSKDSDCPFSMTCNNKKCVKTCDVSSECNIFTQLYSLCNLNTKTCEAVPIPCTEASCKLLGSIYTCSNNLCIEGCNSPGASCPTGTVCNSGTNKCSLSVNCNKDLDCTIQYGSGYSCDLGTQKCKKATCNPANCNGYGCDSVTDQCKTSCTVNADCNVASGYICKANKCTQSCQMNSECASLGAEYQCVAFKCKNMSCPTPTLTPLTACPFGGMVCDSDKICKTKCAVTDDCNSFSNGFNVGCSIINNLCTLGPACTDDTICISTFGVGAKCNTNKLCSPPDCKTALCPENYFCTSAIGCAKFSCTSDANCAVPLDGVPGSCDTTTKFCYNDCTKTGCPPNPAGTSCNTVTKKCEKSSIPNKCISDSVCPASKPYCDIASGVCVSTPPVISCTLDADCPSGKGCVNKVCTINTEGCVKDNDCSVDNICLNKKCELKCDPTTCGGYLCNATNNKCTAACNADKDCTSPAKCNAAQNKCVRCLIDIDCGGNNLVCSNNICTTKQLTPGTCDINAGCKGTNEVCVNSKCIDTTSKSCIELGGTTCESGYDCVDSTPYGTLTSSKCCIPKPNEKAACVSSEQIFVPSQASEVFVKKGPCADGKRDVYYCQNKDSCGNAEKSSEPCTAITKKGSNVDISAFGLYAGVVALLAIIIYYLIFHRRNKTKNKKNVKKKLNKKILKKNNIKKNIKVKKKHTKKH